MAGRDQNPRAPKQGKFPMINDDHAGRKWAITIAKHLRIFFWFAEDSFSRSGSNGEEVHLREPSSFIYFSLLTSIKNCSSLSPVLIEKRV